MEFFILIPIVFVAILIMKKQTDKFYKNNPHASFKNFYFGDEYVVRVVNGKKKRIPINWKY